MTKLRWYLLLTLIISYFLLLRVYTFNNLLPLQVITFCCIFYIAGLHKLREFLARRQETVLKWDLETIKHRSIISFFWIISLLLAHKAELFFTKDIKTEAGTFVFIMYILVSILFKLSTTFHSMLGVSLLIVSTLLYSDEFEKSAEIFASLAFFLFLLSCIKIIIQLVTVPQKKNAL